jgi:tryptophan synthase alpha subunit
MHKKYISYVNRRVIIGIDVHKKTQSVRSICDGVLVVSSIVRADKAITIS